MVIVSDQFNFSFYLSQGKYTCNIVPLIIRNICTQWDSKCSKGISQCVAYLYVGPAMLGSFQLYFQAPNECMYFIELSEMGLAFPEAS